MNQPTKPSRTGTTGSPKGTASDLRNPAENSLYIEGHEVSGQTIVSKRTVIFVVTITVTIRKQSDSLKSIVVNIHSTFVEVGGVEIAITVNESTGKPGVTGTIGSLDYDDGVRGRSRSPACSYADVWVPAGDGASKGGKEKVSGRARSQSRLDWS
jgi:hypothetical protein